MKHGAHLPLAVPTGVLFADKYHTCFHVLGGLGNRQQKIMPTYANEPLHIEDML